MAVAEQKTEGTSATPKLNEAEIRSLRYVSLLVRLIGYLTPHRRLLSVAVVSMLAYSVTIVAMPWTVRLAIDDHIASDSLDLSALAPVVVLFMGLALAQLVTAYIHKLALVLVGQEMIYAVRVEIFAHFQRMPMAFFDHNQTGKVMSRIQNDVQHLQELTFILIISLANLIGAMGIVVAMFFLSAPLAAITVAIVVVMVPAMTVWQRLARVPYQRVRQAIADVNSRIQENISGVRVVQSFSRQQKNIDGFDEANQDHLDANLWANRYVAGLMPTVEGLTAVALALIVIVGGGMVLDETLQIGVVVAFALYIERLFEPVQQMTSQFEQLQKAMVAADRIFELLDVPPEADDAAEEPPPTEGRVHYQVERFQYDGGPIVLQDVDLAIEPGETIAMVGPTGAGKTTMAALLLRLYDVVDGRVSVDGRVWLLTFGAVPLSMIGTALTFHHVSLMSSNGIDQNIAAAILSVMAVAGLASTAISGYLVDRFPIRFVLVVGQALIALTMIWILVVSTAWQGFVYGALLGASQGLVATAQIVIWPRYFGRRYIGSIRGVTAIGMVAASGLGPMPFGILFEITGSYDAAILGFVALPVICGFAAMAAVPPVKGARVS